MDFNRVCVVDIETNTLLSKMLDYSEFPYKLNKEAKLWCVVVRNVGTGEIFSAVKEEVTKEWVEEVLKPFDVIVAHNGIKFDFIALKLFGVLDYRIGYLNEPDLAFGREVKFLDSIILSRLLNPDRYLGHSLDAWGDRVGNQKTNFRQALIDQELLDPKAPRGFEFSFYTETMLDYCIQDTSTNADALRSLLSEIGGYTGWKQGLKMEHKLADLAVRRESLGFFFDKNLAIECLEDLDTKMKAIEAEVNPILPPRPLNKGERDSFTPPKTQFKKDGSPAKYLLDFALRLGAEVYKTGTNYVLNFEGTEFPLPWEGPIKTHCEADISNLDHVKMYLIQLGWVPSEWRERDLTKDSKKQNLPYEKRVLAFDRWYKETIEGKYMEGRLSQFENIPHNMLYDITLNKLSLNKPVRVPTSPSVRVGVEKELCPNLLALGEKVAFAKDFAMWLTYRHRRSSIAGGDIEDMDFDLEYPNTGYLSVYREVDGRVPTPAIEIGAATTRYRHISVANIPRASSPYGDKMRSLFGCGKNAVQFGYDFSSLENRVQAGYIAKYPGGLEMGVALTAEKPNDLHSINAAKLSISRSDAKSLTYATLYGAQPAKLSKMLGVDLSRGQEIFNSFWEAVTPLKMLKENIEEEWMASNKQYIVSIDGRRIRTRSQHSLLNALFQSAGVVCAKYTTVIASEIMEKELGLCIDPFIGEPDYCSMIEYHDEAQAYTNKKFYEFKVFDTEGEAEEFVKNWDGEQLSTIGHGKKYYVCLPNTISKAIIEATKRVEKLLDLKFELGIEWIVGKNWYECH
jgi:hypothetical protein